MPFSLLALTQNGIACLRLTYSDPPRQLDLTDSTDALNPDNYEIDGPRPNLVSSVVSVKGDASSVDVYLTESLIDGDWSLKVINVVAA